MLSCSICICFLSFIYKNKIRYEHMTLGSPYLVRPLTRVDPLMSDQLARFLEALVTCITLMDKGASIYVPFMTLV